MVENKPQLPKYIEENLWKVLKFCSKFEVLNYARKSDLNSRGKQIFSKNEKKKKNNYFIKSVS